MRKDGITVLKFVIPEDLIGNPGFTAGCPLESFEHDNYTW